jgi:hypothetical protein
MTTPPLSNILFFGYFLIIWRSGIMFAIILIFESLLRLMGFGDQDILFFLKAHQLTFEG